MAVPLAAAADPGALGNAFGRLGWHLVASRRKVALRNLELCFPELGSEERVRLAREHFRWLGRSLLERGLLWYASPAAAEAG